MRRLDLAAELAADAGLWRDFIAICDCGGRLAGTESEKRAFALLRERVRAASPANAGRSIPGALRRLAGEGGVLAPARRHDGRPAIRWCARIATPPDGLTAEVIDLGRGTPEEFAAHAGDIKGRIVLVRHELMFAAGTIHRRRKYDMARAKRRGRLPDRRAAGRAMSSRAHRAARTATGIPALGIAPETAAALRAHGAAAGRRSP